MTEQSSNITLHVNDLTVHEREVTVQVARSPHQPQTSSGGMVEVVGHGYDEERQFYIIHLAAAPASPTLTLNIFFTGNLNDELAGFYR